MRRTTRVVSFVAFVFAGTTAWVLLGTLGHPRTAVSITLLGFTNDVTGIPVFDYATSNVAQSGFAVFRAQNPTESRFGCFLSCTLLSDSGPGKGRVILLKRGLRSAQTNGTSLSGEDFQLAPGGTFTFSVPRPGSSGTWQCLVNLIRVRHYKHHWQYKAVVFAQGLGLHFMEQGQTVSSGEIAQ